MQKCLLLAEGISFAGFLRLPITTEYNKPARYRVLPFSVTYRGKAKKNLNQYNPPLKEGLSRTSNPAVEA
jgi:hypothetical protein